MAAEATAEGMGGAPGHGGRAARGALLFLPLSLAVWGWFAWPMPRFITRGIPVSAHNIETPAWRYAIPGDHLQLLYHFDLVHDMFAGRIPPMHNPYEFSTGPEHTGFRPSAYFLPMSAVYALLARATGNRLLAWNLCGWLSIWLSMTFTWLWLRRFTRSPAALGLGVAVSIALPFRWVSLLGGSPAGMALMWLPLIGWGVDAAVREARPAAGFWLGLALLFCGWSDLHVFYFAALNLPLLAWVSLCLTPPARAPWRRWWRVAPWLAVFMAAIVAYHLWRHHLIASSDMAGGRDLNTVRYFSPRLRGVFTHGLGGLDGTIFLGWLTMAAGAAGAAHFAWRSRRAPWRLAAVGVAAAAAAAAVWLSFGVYSPPGGLPLRAARKLIPMYTMIRQPAKAYAALFLWLPWLLAVGWAGLLDTLPRWPAWKRQAAGWLLAAGLILEIRAQLSTTVCLMEPEQDAYAAVAADARAAGLAPGRILVLPLWPGDSTYASVYMHYARQYDLRMVNGYSPMVKQAYLDDIFHRLASANQGWLSDGQADFLLSREIRYVLLHEDHFPEKVSPFPVTFTRDRLLNHPRLDFMTRAGAVWAFRLRGDAKPEGREGSVPAGGAERLTAFPARAWDFERGGGAERIVVEDAACSASAYLELAPGRAPCETPVWRLTPVDGLAWIARVRGAGELAVTTLVDGQPAATNRVAVADEAWRWIESPLPAFGGYQPVAARFEVSSGRVDLDMGLLVAGAWRLPGAPGESASLDGEAFFHAGYSDAEDGSVRFRPEHDPVAAVFYGPRLPLDAGRYAIEWRFASAAAAGTELGRFNVRAHNGPETAWEPMVAGRPARLEWRQDGNLPVTAVFVYGRAAEVRIEGVRIERLENGASGAAP